MASKLFIGLIIAVVVFIIWKVGYRLGYKDGCEHCKSDLLCQQAIEKKDGNIEINIQK